MSLTFLKRSRSIMSTATGWLAREARLSLSGPVLPRSVVEHGTAVPVAQLVSSTSALT